MGPGLLKRLVAFERPVDPTALVDAKLAAIDLERRGAAEDGRRLVNVDPGYLTEAKVVLATRKDRGHRVYLGRGVFAEATLEYRQGDYRPFPWTYADYRTEVVLAFFRNLRAL